MPPSASGPGRWPRTSRSRSSPARPTRSSWPSSTSCWPAPSPRPRRGAGAPRPPRPERSGRLDRSATVRDSLKAEAPEVRAAAVRALAAFPAPGRGSRRASIRSALADADADVRVAAIRLALDRPGLVSDKVLRTALDDPTPEHRIALLAAIEREQGGRGRPPPGRRHQRFARRRQRRRPREGPPGDPGPTRDRRQPGGRGEPARAVPVGQCASEGDRQGPAGLAGKSSVGEAGADLLDLAYFEAKVLPIFNAIGEDGQNCIGCHRSHTILKMVPPGKDGRWSPQAVRANFRAALRVVNLANPSREPPARQADLGGRRGGRGPERPDQEGPRRRRPVRAKTSPEYQTILDWINGARADSRPAAIGDDGASER